MKSALYNLKTKIVRNQMWEKSFIKSNSWMICIELSTKQQKANPDEDPSKDMVNKDVQILFLFVFVY